MSARLIIALVAGLVLSACNLNPFDLGGGGAGGGDGGRDAFDDGMRGDGGVGGDGGPIDATVDACLPSPEICNLLDDDCDGTADDGFNLQADPNNCGMCGQRCQYANAFGTCATGNCAQGACQPGWHDTDVAMPGCEYFCIPTGGGVEVCDGRDNDCDTRTDETFDLADDVNNCGMCGRVCNLLHASERCVASTCQVAMCDAGFVDVDPAVPGCEYQCTPSGGGIESCDGVDNDCDGLVDDGNPGGGAACGTDTGVCVAGTTQCVTGVLFCMGQVGGGAEVCNNLDDDCDAVVDDGFDKQNDPLHCGSCAPCMLSHASAGCALGACTVAACQFGFVNRDGLPGNGCEYQCINTGIERCDGIDNDCDGLIDEGFDLATDPGNCGACGTTCTFTNAAGVCSNQQCGLGACAPNFFDANHLAADGCEYGCVLTNGGVERCDGVDNDCDAIVDDGNPGGGGGCGTDTGACVAGTLQCVNGALDCGGDVTPVAEACNNVDDDCNGAIDNGFDRQNDPRYCGNCTACMLAHAVAGCAMGGCTVAGCLAGWVNLDGQPGNGCEYACTPSGAEVCDGRDNDCDGLTDQMDPSLIVPGNFCRVAGECAGTTPSCTGAGGWDCLYADPDVELDGNGDIVLEESRCDGKDNDCDGGQDEIFPLKGTACAEDGNFGTARRLGACRGTGLLGCNAVGNGLRCNVTALGAAPAAESCNRRDDDCDGHTDEPYDAGGFAGVRDVVTGPLLINGQSIVQYRYEASRPDATGVDPGFVETRACSVAGRLPWASGNLAEVRGACLAAGMRLCKVNRDGAGTITSDEWGRFCEGPAGLVFPYGNVYAPTACNGSDYDPVAGGVNEDLAIGTGNLATCQAPELGRDLSGNVKEWTDDVRVVAGQNVYTLRGGSYDNHAGGLTCDFDLTVVDAGYTFANAGFRCCALACAAGQIECSGACVDAASNNNHCGGCGRVCGGGTACSNGYCCANGTRACGDACVPNAMACP